MKRNYLVTGGAGFIGANIVRELLKEKNNSVYIFDNLSSGNLNNLELDNPNLFYLNFVYDSLDVRL